MGIPQETRSFGQIIHLKPVEHTNDTLNRWVSWINDPKIRQWMYRDLPTSREEINEWLYQATHDERRHYFSIMQNGENIGFISLRQDYAPDNTGEIGIVIGPEALRGKGLGKHALDTILDFAKDTLQLSSVRAMIKPENEPSIRLFTGRGFVKTGDATVNGDHMIRFEKQLDAPSPELQQAAAFFREIGLETPDTSYLVGAAKQFSKELGEGGIAHDPASSLQMIDTKLSPRSPERLRELIGKEVLMIQYWGTNIRVAIGKIGEDGLPSYATFEEGGAKKIEGNFSKSVFSSPEDFYMEVFRLIDATQGVILPETMPETVGIIWAFPGVAVQTGHGIDNFGQSELTKGIVVHGLDDKFVGESFVSAFKQRYYPESATQPKILVVNDTPAALLSNPESNGMNQIGVIDGTGFNIALQANGTIYNLEAGSFQGIPLPPYIQDLESRFGNPGKDFAEKQCSGKYVGAEFDALTQALIDKKLIGGTKQGTLDGRDMDQLLLGNAAFLEQKLGHILTRDERTILTDLATRLRNRAAVVIGLLVGMTVRTFSDGFDERVSIPVEGMFFIKTPGLRELASVVATSVAGKPVEFRPGVNFVFQGAVAAAASL